MTVVNKDTWDQFTLQERIASQYMHNVNDYYHKVHISEDKPDELKYKKIAVEKVVEKLMTEMMNDTNALQNNNMDEERTVSITDTSSRSLPYKRAMVEKFIDALRYNLIFNVGFDVMGLDPGDEKSCLCPCCKNMIKWRQNFNLLFMTERDVCHGFQRFTTPKGLMDHLHKLGTQGGYLHRGVELYLIEMYKHFWEDVGHKDLYQINDRNYKAAVAKENRVKFNQLCQATMEIKQKDEELRLGREQIKELEKMNEKLTDTYNLKKKISDAMKLEVSKTPTLEDKDIEKWQKLSQAYFHAIKKVLKLKDRKEKKNQERIIIKLPNKFIIQDFFEERCKESSPTSSTFLFRDFSTNEAHIPNNFYSYKLFLDWDVQFDDEGDAIQGIDEGGPTSQFISDFCKQLGDLFVMLPIMEDVKVQVNLIDISRNKLDENVFLQPERGYKVLYKGRKATVKRYYPGNINEPDIACLSFDYKEKELIRVERKDFELIEVAIPLFDQQSSGFVPQRDDYFMNAHNRAKPYSPQMDLSEVEDKAKLYYRAVGRFLLHVMSDGRNPIPSNTMPDLFRNVLLRNCLPGTADYPDDLVRLHLSKLEIDGMRNVKKFFGLEFKDMGIEKEGIITQENFISEFVPEYVIQSRSNNLKALHDGLTLEGEFPIDHILGCQPLQAVSKQFFSQQNTFLSETIPETINTVKRRIGSEGGKTKKMKNGDEKGSKFLPPIVRENLQR